VRGTQLVTQLDTAQRLWDAGELAESVRGPVRDWLESLTVSTRAREYVLDWREEELLLYVSWLDSDDPRAVIRHTQTDTLEDLPEELAEWLWTELDWHIGPAESTYLVTVETVHRVKAESPEDALSRFHCDSVTVDQTHTVEEEL